MSNVPIALILLLLLGILANARSNELSEQIPILRDQMEALQREEKSEADELRAELARLRDEMDSLRKLVLPVSATARTCDELKLSNPSLASGMYWVDPDGHGTGDAAIHVFCNMSSGSTSVIHDSEDPTNVGHCWDSGCYSRSVTYNATMRQMIALTELSYICTQSIQYDCRSAPMEFNGVAQSWWTDRSGMRHVDFTGANSGQSRCQCALEGNCLDKELGCNCNSVSPIPTSDTGLITDKTLLPVTRLNFGRILTPPASGRHTLGRMTCFGRLFASPSKPSSCQDLWRSGHTISGFYQVQDSPAGGIETVFCDMTQVPGQGSIASPDLKQESLRKRMESAERLIQEQANRAEELQSGLKDLSGALSRNSETLGAKIKKLELTENRLERDVKSLSVSRQRHGAELAQLRNRTTFGVPLRRIPSSCRDLRTMGHTLSGLYPVKGRKQVEMVYCDMAHPSGAQQTWIGGVDVKSSPVQFYVQRNSSFYLEGNRNLLSDLSAVLPFQIERSNIGRGMDIGTGVFTAPRSGTYVFNFSGIKRDQAKYVNVYLYVDDSDRVASVYGSQHQGYFTLSLQSILHLKARSTVKLVLETVPGGGLYDDKDMTTHFSGFLLEEDLF